MSADGRWELLPQDKIIYSQWKKKETLSREVVDEQSLRHFVAGVTRSSISLSDVERKICDVI